MIVERKIHPLSLLTLIIKSSRKIETIPPFHFNQSTIRTKKKTSTKKLFSQRPSKSLSLNRAPNKQPKTPLQTRTPQLMSQERTYRSIMRNKKVRFSNFRFKEELEVFQILIRIKTRNSKIMIHRFSKSSNSSSISPPHHHTSDIRQMKTLKRRGQ